MMVFLLFYYKRFRGAFLSQEEAELAANEILCQDQLPQNLDHINFYLIKIEIGEYQQGKISGDFDYGERINLVLDRRSK